jgi:O-antigen/teichoic acid export membrane protein
VYFFGSFLLIAELFSLRWFFYGIEKMKFIPAIQLFGTLMNVILVLLFVKQPENYSYIILFEGLGLLVANSISFSYIILEYKIHLKLVSFHTVKKYLYHNFYAFINVMIPSMLSNTAVFMMGLLSIPAHVSIVQLGVKFSNAFSTMNTILTKVFYAMVNRQRDFMKTSFRVLIVVGAILSLAMFISADLLIEPWLKLENIIALNQVIFMVKLLSPMPLMMALISAYGVNGLLVYHKDKMVGIITIITTVIGVVVGIILIPIFTFIGGAIFLLTVRGLYALLSVILFKKNVKLEQNKVF